MYRENRPLWLEFSRKNLKRYPIKLDRYKAFLRECYQKQQPYSVEKLIQIKQNLKLAIPIDELLAYGNDCNWLTRNGRPFSSAKIFCVVYNGVWLEKQRKTAKQDVEETLFDYLGEQV